MLRAEPLAQRVLGDQRLELADHVAVMPEREVGLDPPFERGEAELLEARALVPGERLRELGECRPAPERERVAQQLPRLPGIALRERLPAVGDRALEAGQVELVVADLEQVAGSACLQPRLRKRLPQLRDVDLHHLLRRVRHVLAPEGVDDLLAGDGAVRVQEQDREERPLLARRDLHLRGSSEASSGPRSRKSISRRAQR